MDFNLAYPEICPENISLFGKITFVNALSSFKWHEAEDVGDICQPVRLSE